MPFQEFERRRFRIPFRQPAGPHPVEQAGRTVVGAIPLVHAAEPLRRLCDGDVRALRNDREPVVGDYRGDFDDDIAPGIQAGHLQVDPDESGFLCHRVLQ